MQKQLALLELTKFLKIIMLKPLPLDTQEFLDVDSYRMGRNDALVAILEKINELGEI